MDDTAWSKLDNGLRREVERLRGNPAAEVHVMVSLHPPQARADETIQEKQDRFREESADLRRQLEQSGARDVEGYWLNSTVSARIPVGALEAIARRSDVKQILLLTKHRAVL